MLKHGKTVQTVKILYAQNTFNWMWL